MVYEIFKYNYYFELFKTLLPFKIAIVYYSLFFSVSKVIVYHLYPIIMLFNIYYLTKVLENLLDKKSKNVFALGWEFKIK